jgi:hypothetical protein
MRLPWVNRLILPDLADEGGFQTRPLPQTSPLLQTHPYDGLSILA